MSLSAFLVLNFAVMAFLMLFLGVAFHVLPTREYRIRKGELLRPPAAKRWAAIPKNMLISGGFMAGFSFAASPWLLHDGESGFVPAVLDGLAILLIYDFGYYLLHRFAFHEWNLLRKVHAVHHKVKHTASVDSLYLHPLELALGIALLIVSGLLWGPVSVSTWGVILLIYSSLNILIHSGLDLPWRGWGVFNFLARKHAIHHLGMQRGNYASISPIFDILFGTSE